MITKYVFTMTSCEHQEILSHGLISCWNRKLSHRFLGLFDCFTCSFILCGNSTEFPEQPIVHHSHYKWFQSNLEGVNRRAYDKNLSKRCSVQWDGWASESCVTVFPAYWYSCLSPHVSDRASVLGSANGEGEFCASYLSQDWGSLAVDTKRSELRRWCVGKTGLINLFNWYAGAAWVLGTWMKLCTVIWKV